jgi:hypothetical protein
MTMDRGASPSTTPDWRAVGRRRTLFYLLMALGFGFIAILAANAAINQIAVNRGVTFRRAVVAVQDIPNGAVIVREALTVADVNMAPRDALTEMDQAVGKWSRYPIVRGEIVSYGKLLTLDPAAVAAGAPLGMSAPRPRPSPRRWFTWALLVPRVPPATASSA